jgi:DNA modification methylase
LKIDNDKFDTSDSFYQFLYDAFLNLYILTKEGSPIYVCHADSEGLNFRKAFQDAGYLLKQCIVWNKNTMVMGRQDYQWKHEPILYGWKAGKAHKWYGGRNKYTVWDIDKPSRSGEHPTMKPLELVSIAIQNSSKHDDLVLDTFGGSGSTLIACEQTNRVCYMMELDPHYCDVIIDRWEKFTGKTANLIDE